MNTHSTARERVEFGLETIPEDRVVTVSLRDLLFVHQTVGEFIQFFHQPMHYRTLSEVEEFLGSGDPSGANRVLADAYYKRMRNMIPPDIDEAFGDGARFDHSVPPKYFRADPDEI